MPQLITTLGPKTRDELGMILPHEHVFVDLRTWDQPGYGEGDAEDVVRLMAPEIAKAQALGVTAIVEPGPIGVGRRVDILKAVSEATGLPLVAPTGVYREPWVPPWVVAASENDLRDWMVAELTNGVEETGVRAGWIKVSAGDHGLTAVETTILRAAGAAAATTGTTVGSHTMRGRVAMEQLDLLESVGCPPNRFVWIHTHLEPDIDLHRSAAKRGAWLEYDGIGGEGTDELFLRLVLSALDAGLGDQVLLSHDRGWYDPAQPAGGTPQPYTYLSEVFLPKLSDAGVDDGTIRQLTHDNPFNAFAR